jgi:uncharacterized protein (TIGR02757 family)
MKVPRAPLISKPCLEALYHTYNSQKWIHPDPLEFLYLYEDPNDREIVGLIVSSLAYGRVAQILKSVASVLEKMGPSPCRFLEKTPAQSLQNIFFDFKHRFSTSEELVGMFMGIKRAVDRYGSLYGCFISGFKESDQDTLPALSFLVDQLRVGFNGRCNSLLPSPQRGSACKRLNLFLRWMIREDFVDPGGWSGIPTTKLIVPLDTHMHRICSLLRLTCRKNTGMRTALEITSAFRRVHPQDPVRYDFALTRFGIRKDLNPSALFSFFRRL